MKKTSRIYISGHTGMVGKTLYELMKKKGYKNLIVKTSKELDLRDQKALERFFKKEKPEYIFHFAAKVGGIMANIENPTMFLYDNLMIGYNVISAAHKAKVKKLINLGSSCIYPRNAPQPMKEEYLLSGKLEPTNEGYALAKIATLKLCEYYNAQYGTEFISLMPCNLYGINEHFDLNYSHVLASLIMKMHEAKMKKQEALTLWGSGKARREFLYVEDFVQIALWFMENITIKNINNTFINIGSGIDYSIKELADIVAKIVGYNGVIKWDHAMPDGMPRKLLDITRMKQQGTFALRTMQEGVKSTYRYYLTKKHN